MIEMRCPTPVPGKHHSLFGELDDADAVLRFACPDCRRAVRSAYPRLRHVIHAYSAVTGGLVGTEWVWLDGRTTPPRSVP